MGFCHDSSADTARNTGRTCKIRANRAGASGSIHRAEPAGFATPSRSTWVHLAARKRAGRRVTLQASTELVGAPIARAAGRYPKSDGESVGFKWAPRMRNRISRTAARTYKYVLYGKALVGRWSGQMGHHTPSYWFFVRLCHDSARSTAQNTVQRVKFR